MTPERFIAFLAALAETGNGLAVLHLARMVAAEDKAAEMEAITEEILASVGPLVTMFASMELGALGDAIDMARTLAASPWN